MREKTYSVKLTQEELWVLMDNFAKSYSGSDEENHIERGILRKLHGAYRRADLGRSLLARDIKTKGESNG